MAGDDGQRVAMVWDDRLVGYDLGPEHPLAPVRVELTVELIRGIGLPDLAHVDVVRPGDFDEAELLRLHRPSYVEAVRRLSAYPDGLGGDHVTYGLGPGDTPAFAGMHETSMLVNAATKEAARLVWEGDAVHAFNPAGGLHHAMPDRAAGFCVYNDPALAIDWLLEHGAERVAYIDVDVHHGDGVEAMFVDDPRVLTVSLHESPRYLFPGTGRSEDIGGHAARGSAANLPLLPGTTGDVWMRAFEHGAVPLVRAFRPDVIVSQLGCDTHLCDPLAHLALLVDDHAAIAARIHQLAHELCDGRWVATGGGGYRLVDVVPRAWTAAFAEMVGEPLPELTPVAWRELAEARGRGAAPTTFRDEPFSIEEHIVRRAEAAADEAVEAVHRLVLPHHGRAR